MKRAREKGRKRLKTRPRTVANKKKKKNKKKVFLTVLLCVIVVIFIALGFGGEDNSLIPIDDSTGKMNILVLGTDQSGLRTDAMMVASYDFDAESLKLLSIPRDTKVYVSNRKVTRKINEVHAMTKQKGEIMGPLGSVEAVSAITGIPINYYVEFNFDAIDHMMDILGPVTFDVPDVEGNGKGMNYDDPYQDLHIHLKPGVQKLSGNQVQQFLRYRKSNDKNSDGSDTSRVERQQAFIKALIEQKVNLSLIVKAPDIFAQLKKEIKTNFSASEIARYSTHLLKLKTENITTFSLPGEDKYVGGGWYFVCDTEATKELVGTEFGYDAENITTTVEITGEKYSPQKAEKAKEEKSEEKENVTEKKQISEPKADDEEKKQEATNTPTKEPEVTKTPTEELRKENEESKEEEEEVLVID